MCFLLLFDFLLQEVRQPAAEGLPAAVSDLRAAADDEGDAQPRAHRHPPSADHDDRGGQAGWWFFDVSLIFDL